MLYQLSYISLPTTYYCQPPLQTLERETGIEPATNSLEGCDSTTELLPPIQLALLVFASLTLFFALQLPAVAPRSNREHGQDRYRSQPKPLIGKRRPRQYHQHGDRAHRNPKPLHFRSWCTGEDSNLRSPLGAADLQSAAINHSATCARVMAAELPHEALVSGHDFSRAVALFLLIRRADSSPRGSQPSRFASATTYAEQIFRPGIAHSRYQRSLRQKRTHSKTPLSPHCAAFTQNRFGKLLGFSSLGEFCDLPGLLLLLRLVAHSRLRFWSWRRDLNPRPSDYKSDALPAELRQRAARLGHIPRQAEFSLLTGTIIKSSTRALPLQPAFQSA